MEGGVGVGVGVAPCRKEKRRRMREHATRQTTESTEGRARALEEIVGVWEEDQRDWSKQKQQKHISEKQTALKDLVKQLHDFEGQVDPDTFMNHLDKAVKTTLSKSEFDTMITETVNSPSSLSYIPRFDIGNINYSFIQYLFSLKKDNDTDTLGKYRLFANS